MSFVVAMLQSSQSEGSAYVGCFQNAMTYLNNINSQTVDLCIGYCLIDGMSTHMSFSTVLYRDSIHVCVLWTLLELDCHIFSV